MQDQLNFIFCQVVGTVSYNRSLYLYAHDHVHQFILFFCQDWIARSDKYQLIVLLFQNCRHLGRNKYQLRRIPCQDWIARSDKYQLIPLLFQNCQLILLLCQEWWHRIINNISSYPILSQAFRKRVLRYQLVLIFCQGWRIISSPNLSLSGPWAQVPTI